VVTATRNRPGPLAAALRSIAAQSFTRFESIVVDDGSKSATLSEYDSLWSTLDGRFRLLRGPAADLPGTGPAAARNRGWQAARGELVAFLDDDDLWTARDYLAVGVESLQRHQGDFFFTDMEGVRQERPVIASWWDQGPAPRWGERIQEQPPLFLLQRRGLRTLMKHHVVHPDQMIVRRELLSQVNGFWERIRFMEDYELMMRLLDRARRVIYWPEIAVRYRLPTGDSISLIDTKKDHLVQIIAGTQHIRATCMQGLVRSCARAREAWTMRQLAQMLSAEGRGGAALSLAWQGLCVYPTLGGCADLARLLGRGLLQLFKRRSS
jgi:glycosyltransferase involved in cell wall biosynthesis